MHCLQCVFYSLLSLLKHRVYVCKAGIKTIFRPKKSYNAGTVPPGFKIPGSATNKVNAIQCLKGQVKSNSKTEITIFNPNFI